MATADAVAERPATAFGPISRVVADTVSATPKKVEAMADTPGRGSAQATEKAEKTKVMGDGGDPERSRLGQREVEADTDQYEFSPSDEPDVVLDVPQLEVDEISLEVDNLQARIAVQAKLAELVQLNVGADVAIERVALQITGVEAHALLKARLHNVRAILDRALTTVDRNPDLLKELVNTVDDAVGELGDTAEEALGPGGAVSETTQRAAGAAERALGPGGAVSETAEQAGQTGQQAAGQLGERVAEAEEGLDGDYEAEEGYEQVPQAEADEELEEDYEEEPQARDEELEGEKEQERRHESPRPDRRPASVSERKRSGSRHSPPRPSRPAVGADRAVRHR